MTRRLRLLSVPYDSGRLGVRYGAGPGALVDAGAVPALARAGADVDMAVVSCDPLPWGEMAAYVEVVREVRRHVAAACDDGVAPVVLAGSCGATLGVLSGLVAGRVGVVWLDAHGDLHSPETTTSGFVDGMALSMLTGRSWVSLTRTVPGFEPLDDRAVLLVGAHDLDAPEVQAIEGSRIGLLPAGTLRRDPGALDAALATLVVGVDALHLHVDLDVHDVSEGRANGYARPGGLAADQVRAVVTAAAAHRPVVSATVASWDPALDVDGRMRRVALRLLETIGRAMAP